MKLFESIPMFWKKKKKEIIKTSNLKEFHVDDNGFPIISSKHQQMLHEKKMLVNYPINSDVITKSNNDEPYQRGKLVNYVALSLSSNLTPMVRYENEETFVVLGMLRHYSKELCEALDKLDGTDQWNVLSEWHKISKLK